MTKATDESKSSKNEKLTTRKPAARVHRHTLIEMNISVFTARRDAAHERVLDILRREMLASAKELREKLYSVCRDMLEDAIQCTRRSQVQADSPVLHYFTLLHNTISASQALVRHEMTIAEESEQFAEMLNEYVVAQLETANDLFSDSEMNILDCIEDLLKFGEPILQQDAESRLKAFREDDKRRYDLALNQYRDYYRQMTEKAEKRHADSAQAA
ncbi:MAG: hypothetical protein R6V56_02740 [Lentisphaeria bacterium]